MAKMDGPSDISWPQIVQLAGDVQNGKVSAVSLVEKSLDRIKTVDSEYNALISLLEHAALHRAKEIDDRVARGETVGRLAGVPFIAKDNFLVFGAETTAGSNMLKGFQPPYQSTAINRLEAEGAICVAKANMDAFAHGSSTENSDFFVTKNPHDKTRVAGGSSGGSAASIALGYVPFALGTDTGGSIREPASFCGVVGYKPTYGLVSRSGVVAMASSTDVVGPFATSVMDAALVLDVMAGQDVLDGTTIKKPDSDLSTQELDLKETKIGIIKEFFEEGVNEDVKTRVQETIELLRKSGTDIVEVSLPSIKLALAVYYIIVPAELSSNLARHDGQRYQFSATHVSSLEESYVESRSQGFGAEAKRRIMIGTHVLSSGYYDAYYKKAQTVRTKLIQEMEEVLQKVDFLVGPVVPATAFKIGENEDDPIKMYLQDIMTVAANLTGMPAISLPCGKDSAGLPIGIQLIGSQKADARLLSVSASLEGLLS